MVLSPLSVLSIKQHSVVRWVVANWAAGEMWGKFGPQKWSLFIDMYIDRMTASSVCIGVCERFPRVFTSDTSMVSLARN